MNISTELHPAVVHLPIALFLLATAAGLLYLFWRTLDALRILTWIPMLLGEIAGLVAVLTGLLAQSGLPPDAPYRGVLNLHIGAGLGQLVVYGFLLYRRWLFDKAKARHARAAAGVDYPDLLDDPSARVWVALLLVLGALLVLATGWNGGRLVYGWGVNVRG